jgi:hypothetical protein
MESPSRPLKRRRGCEIIIQYYNKNNKNNNKNNKKETNKRYSKEGDALSSNFFAPHDANIPSFSIAKTSPKLARRSARIGHHYEKREQ